MMLIMSVHIKAKDKAILTVLTQRSGSQTKEIIRIAQEA